jgi:hypothetical protein
MHPLFRVAGFVLVVADFVRSADATDRSGRFHPGTIPNSGEQIPQNVR